MNNKELKDKFEELNIELLNDQCNAFLFWFHVMPIRTFMSNAGGT